MSFHAWPADMPPEMKERRSGRRQVTLMRVGLLHTGEGKEFCLVRNLSEGGLMARVYRGFRPGERIEVELKSDELLTGDVVWARGHEIGVQFRSSVDVANVLSVQWDGAAEMRPRLPRLDLDCPAIARQGAESLAIRVRDISHRGAKIRSRGLLVKPAAVVLALPHLPSIHGVVRWTRHEEAGVLFNECLPFEVLARCTGERRASEHGAAQGGLRPACVAGPHPAGGMTNLDPLAHPITAIRDQRPGRSC